MSRGKIEFIDGDGLPDIAVDFGRDLSEIPTRQLKVRTSTGVYITKTMLVDDAATGLGHFEFADGELPAGDHLFNIITTELDGRQRSYPASGSIPLLVRNEFSDSLRSNNRNGTIIIRGEDTTLAIDVVQTDQRDGSLLLVGTPTDGDYTDGATVIVAGDTIADAVDILNVGLLSAGNTTTEALILPVDYDDGTAVDPVPGTIFKTQAHVDAYLADNATSNFKHLQSIWDATPALVSHNLTFSCKGGIHRPTVAKPAPFIAWDLSGKTTTTTSAEISIAGDSNTSDWETVATAETITSHDTAQGDPSITMSGAAYTPGALKGYLAVISVSGQITPIIGNTATQITLQGGFIFDAAPTNGTSTVTVMNPNTQFSDSLDNIAPYHEGAFAVRGNSIHTTINVENIRFNVWSIGGSITLFSEINMQLKNIVVDGNFTGASTAGIGINMIGPLAGFIQSVSVACDQNTGFSFPIETAFNSSGEVAIELRSCYFGIGAAAGGTVALLGEGMIRMFSASFHGCRLRVSDGMMFDLSVFAKFYGRHNNVSHYPGPEPAMELNVNTAAAAVAGDPSQLMYFEGNTGPCIRLSSGAVWGGADRAAGQLDISFLNVPGGAANSDVGIEITGSGNVLQLKADTDVSGTVGDLRIDGIVGPYSSIGTRAAPLVTTNMNSIGIG